MILLSSPIPVGEHLLGRAVAPGINQDLLEREIENLVSDSELQAHLVGRNIVSDVDQSRHSASRQKGSLAQRRRFPIGTFHFVD